MHDVARLGGAGTQPLDHLGIAPGRHEADVLAVRLVRHRQPVARRERPRRGLRREPAQGEAQVGELRRRGREQEVALVARRVGGAVQLGSPPAIDAADIVPGGHAVGVELAGGLHQVAELDPLVAADAGHRRGAGEVGVGEVLDDRFAEAVLVVEHVVGDADRLRHPPRVVDVAAGAAGALAADRRPVVVELQRHAHHVVAVIGEHAPRPPSCRRHPTSRRGRGCRAAPCAVRGCSLGEALAASGGCDGNIVKP